MGTGRNSRGLPRLIVIRGDSASGKSAIAAAIRDRHGKRDLAVIGQDNLRRVILREHDVPGGTNIDLIDTVARFALSRGYHALVEGIFNADHYGAMLTALISDNPGLAFAYFLDVPFPETLRRHASKTGTLKYGEAGEARAPAEVRRITASRYLRIGVATKPRWPLTVMPHARTERQARGTSSHVGPVTGRNRHV